jgi:hypothetical protein
MHAHKALKLALRNILFTAKLGHYPWEGPAGMKPEEIDIGALRVIIIEE